MRSGEEEACGDAAGARLNGFAGLGHMARAAGAREQSEDDEDRNGPEQAEERREAIEAIGIVDLETSRKRRCYSYIGHRNPPALAFCVGHSLIQCHNGP
ncbi:hypothetical protein GCM10010862_23910 [Devosia nitrariae]|uniref:Uncharacterized protein n=1 Tax=Devosia nitrariae TaxID=2071872 RepID=A0ABQ5W5I6_9HYPH|nr:hypothetical protein GCM10010862_23910 [Devosia nitrariae]